MVYLCCSSQNQGHKWVVHNFLYRLPWIPIFVTYRLFQWKPQDFHGNHVITKPKLQNSDSHARFSFVGKLVFYGIPWFATWFPNFPWMSSISARSRVVLLGIGFFHDRPPSAPEIFSSRGAHPLSQKHRISTAFHEESLHRLFVLQNIYLFNAKIHNGVFRIPKSRTVMPIRVCAY